MKDNVNCEGPLFSEWICAAGLATFRNNLVNEYSESYQYSVEHGREHYTRGGCYTDPRLLKRRTVRHYSEKIRKAWRNGEDPTEYR